MRIAGAALAALMVMTALAGCSDGSDTTDDEEFHDLGLKASEKTGVVRGVVVDESITPVAGASVVVQGLGLETTSNAEGAFGFGDLEPGGHFLTVSKPGYKDAQAPVEVAAGVDRPDVVKVLLEADPSTRPFVEQFKFDGYIECSFSLVAAGLAACSTAGSDNDVFLTEYGLDRVPDWAQAEAQWSSTQALGDRVTLLFSAPGEGALLDNYGEEEGTSPLLVSANRTTLDGYGVGAGQTLMVRVFNAPVEGTRPPDPLDGDDCFDRPALGGCLTGIGATLNQEFTVYTHVFHNLVPEEGWSFIDDGDHPLP